jgi:hypothetical protein
MTMDISPNLDAILIKKVRKFGILHTLQAHLQTPYVLSRLPGVYTATVLVQLNTEARANILTARNLWQQLSSRHRTFAAKPDREDVTQQSGIRALLIGPSNAVASARQAHCVSSA